MKANSLYARGLRVLRHLADIGLAREGFGYEPIVEFREGIEQTVAWYKTVINFANSHAGSDL